MIRRPEEVPGAPPEVLADLAEQYPRSELTIREGRCAQDDEDLLFLFLSDREVFLKLTRHCNNQCRFCCDTVFWNGTDMTPERVRAKIAEGAERGYRTLFLSGGEPTIHPQFLEFIRYGSELGYEEIITITNGRMFFYHEFVSSCVQAGLTQAVVSLNSHHEQTHDSLVSVKGAYRQVRRGIANLRRLGCRFNMSAVVNRMNLQHLPQMVRAYSRWGAGAVTFMQLIPNDRDWERSRGVIYYDLAEGQRPVREALEVAADLRFVVELKKFPAPFFEDFEEQIPAPLSWALELSEIDWRRPERFGPYRRGEAISCYGERCAHCAYSLFCHYLMDHQARRREGRFDGFELQVKGPGGAAWSGGVETALSRQPRAPLRLLAPDARVAAPLLTTMAGRPLELMLARMDGVSALPQDVALVVADGPGLDAVMDLDRHLVVVLNLLTARWLKTHRRWVGEHARRLTITPHRFLRLQTALRGQVDLAATLAALPLEGATFVAIPPCLGGPSGQQRGPRGKMERASARGKQTGGDPPEQGLLPHVVTEDLLAEPEDVPAHARHFYWQRCFTKSVRCSGCSVTDRCDGVHINYVRQFGYRSLVPLP